MVANENVFDRASIQALHCPMKLHSPKTIKLSRMNSILVKFVAASRPLSALHLFRSFCRTKRYRLDVRRNYPVLWGLLRLLARKSPMQNSAVVVTGWLEKGLGLFSLYTLGIASRQALAISFLMKVSAWHLEELCFSRRLGVCFGNNFIISTGFYRAKDSQQKKFIYCLIHNLFRWQQYLPWQAKHWFRTVFQLNGSFDCLTVVSFSDNSILNHLSADTFSMCDQSLRLILLRPIKPKLL